MRERYPRSIPIYFWAGREGSRIAEESMMSHRVRIVAAYARRPKVFNTDQLSILVKINAQLFAGAVKGKEYGIPVLAGVPLVTSLSDFSIGVPCSWFHLKPGSLKQNDFEFLIPISGQVHIQNFEPLISGPLARIQINDLIESETREMSWSKAIEGIRAIRASGHIFVSPFFIAGYRPFFMVVLL